MASLKITVHRVDAHHLAGRVQREPRRLVHPRVGGHDGRRPEDAREHDRHAGPEVRPRLQPSPAVDVDGDEDRLGEEEDALEGERHAEGLTPLAHEPRPQQTELERQHGAGDGAHREGDGHVLRPALGQAQRVGVVALQPPVVGDERHERPRHPERHEDDVEGEREGHLGSGPGHRVDREHVAGCPGQEAVHPRHPTGCPGRTSSSEGDAAAVPAP